MKLECQKVEQAKLCEWANLMIAETSSEAGVDIIERKVQPLQTYTSWKKSKFGFLYVDVYLMYTHKVITFFLIIKLFHLILFILFKGFQIWKSHNCCTRLMVLKMGKGFWWPAQKVFLPFHNCLTFVKDHTGYEIKE